MPRPTKPLSETDRSAGLRGLRAMPSLGKASADLLADVGILNPAMLREAGAVETWRRLRFAHGRRITITWIYALEVAIRGIPWKSLPARSAKRLRAEAEAIVADLECTPSRPTNRSPNSRKQV